MNLKFRSWYFTKKVSERDNKVDTAKEKSRNIEDRKKCININMKGVLKDRTKIFLKECYPRIYKDKRKIIASWLKSFRVLQASHLEIFLWNLSKWKTKKCVSKPPEMKELFPRQKTNSIRSTSNFNGNFDGGRKWVVFSNV